MNPQRACSGSPLDEWTLSEVAGVLWRARWAIVLLTTLCTLIVIFNSTWQFFRQPQAWRNELTFRLTFAGAREGKFPNNLPFSAAGIVAPGVLARAEQEKGLATRCTSPDGFRQSVSIAPAVGDGRFVLRLEPSDACPGVSDRHAVAALNAVLRAWQTAPETVKGFQTVNPWFRHDRFALLVTSTDGTLLARREDLGGIVRDFGLDITRMRGRLPVELRGGPADASPSLGRELDALGVLLMQGVAADANTSAEGRQRIERVIRGVRTRLAAQRKRVAALQATQAAVVAGAKTGPPTLARDLTDATAIEANLVQDLNFYERALAQDVRSKPVAAQTSQQRDAAQRAAATALLAHFDAALAHALALRFGTPDRTVVVEAASSRRIQNFDTRTHVLVALNVFLMALAAAVLGALLRQRVHEWREG